MEDSSDNDLIRNNIIGLDKDGNAAAGLANKLGWRLDALGTSKWIGNQTQAP